MTTEIQLTRGYVAIVDDIDADLAEFKWTAMVSKFRVYATRSIYVDGKWSNVLMHRIILGRVLGRELLPSEMVDHEMEGGLNNVRSNLRLATYQQNMRNRVQNSNSTSPYKGICFYKQHGKWGGFIEVDGKKKFLGLHLDPLSAHRAYCIAALTHYSVFSNFGSNSPFLGMTLDQLEAPVIQLALPLKDAA